MEMNKLTFLIGLWWWEKGEPGTGFQRIRKLRLIGHEKSITLSFSICETFSLFPRCVYSSLSEGFGVCFSCHWAEWFGGFSSWVQLVGTWRGGQAETLRLFAVRSPPKPAKTRENRFRVEKIWWRVNEPAHQFNVAMAHKTNVYLIASVQCSSNCVTHIDEKLSMIGMCQNVRW